MAKGVKRYIVLTNGVPVPKMMTLKEINEKVRGSQGPQFFTTHKVYSPDANGSLVRVWPKYTITLVDEAPPAPKPVFRGGPEDVQ